MTDLDKIKDIFAPQLDWYNTNKADEDYIYDEAWQEFSDVSRGDWLRFLQIMNGEYKDPN